MSSLIRMTFLLLRVFPAAFFFLEKEMRGVSERIDMGICRVKEWDSETYWDWSSRCLCFQLSVFQAATNQPSLDSRAQMQLKCSQHDRPLCTSQMAAFPHLKIIYCFSTTFHGAKWFSMLSEENSPAEFCVVGFFFPPLGAAPLLIPGRTLAWFISPP